MKEFVLEIKKSKFLAFALETNSATQAQEVFQALKKQHKKANHVCYAYKIVSNGVEQVKFSDDGEPSGTAGKPILSVIEKKNMENVAVYVVRYFGGVKLGAGGLVRAYSKAASGVLN